MNLQDFKELLSSASQELFAMDRGSMTRPGLIETQNPIDPGDVALFGRAVEAGLVTVYEGGRFDTRDRPTGAGRWGLLSRSVQGGAFNAEYLPQIAAYARAVLDLGYPSERVLFELPESGLQLDLAILDDAGRVVVLGEAKREVRMLDKLLEQMSARFAAAAPTEDSKRRGDEVRQLAWRLWAVRPERLWLIAPGVVRSWTCRFDPLVLTPEQELPTAASLGLAERPPATIPSPRLLREER